LKLIKEKLQSAIPGTKERVLERIKIIEEELEENNDGIEPLNLD